MIDRKIKFIWAIFFLVGLISLIVRLTGGEHVADSSGYMPWGLWVAVYVYFVGISAGMFYFAAASYVFGWRILERVAKLALYTALCTLAGGLIAICMDLGHPFRAWKVFVSPNFSSMMTWMIWLYLAYAVLLITMLRYAARRDLSQAAKRSDWLGRFMARLQPASASSGEDTEKLMRLGLIGIPIVLTFNGGVGSLFGVIGARPYWNSALMPILFIVSGLLSASAFLTVFVALFWRDKRASDYRQLLVTLSTVTLGLLSFEMLLEWSEFSINLYSSIPAHAEAFKLVIFGPYWWVFWFVHLLFGVLVPLLLLAPRANREDRFKMGAAGGLIIVTFLAVRLNVVIPGLALEEMHGLAAAYSDSRLNFDYLPSFWEWGVTLFAFSLVLGLLYAGTRNFSLLGERVSN